MSGTLLGAAVVLIGLIVEAGKEVYAQLAVVAPDVADRVGYLAVGPQSHQLIGLYHGAPSATQVGLSAVGACEIDDDPELNVAMTVELRVELVADWSRIWTRWYWKQILGKFC